MSKRQKANRDLKRIREARRLFDLSEDVATDEQMLVAWEMVRSGVSVPETLSKVFGMDAAEMQTIHDMLDPVIEALVAEGMTHDEAVVFINDTLDRMAASPVDGQHGR